ncbi:phosphopantetheine-binding protein [Sinomonas sp. JGH33]|uniref:Phosphopantetheine-binding protein n=1 Tax=Sinomonas terricola TaxID=3110330 RepID=A0ABU5T2K0_9MICC|nr:phosphopantetheine-binding protein [Sinomonas sp. JGH33]MEA5453701.1 phosphopantetheine-binding protein [Sinomonas sp. JGH33]
MEMIPEITLDGLRELMISRLSLDMEPEDIVPDMSLLQDLGLDSVDLLEVAIGIERTYKIKITQNDTAAFATLQSLYDFCREQGLATVK